MEEDNPTKIQEFSYKPNPENSGEIQEKRDDMGRFLPGISGNPAGKPLGTISMASILKRELVKIIPSMNPDEKITYGEAVVRKMLQKAIVDGDFQFIKEIFNRVETGRNQIGNSTSLIKMLSEAEKILMEKPGADE